MIDFYFTRNEFIPLIESYEEDRDLYLKDYEDEQAFLMIGEAYEKLGLFEEALKIYRGITNGKEMKGEALFKMGKIHKLLGDYHAAGELLSRFTVNFKDSQLLAAAELTLAATFYRSGKFSKAIPLYFSSYTSKPELGDPWGYFCLGNALKKLGRLSRAVDAYRKSVEIRMEKEESTDNPDFITQCHFLIADCFFRDRKYQDALAAYLSVLKKYPGDKRVPWAWYRICVCYKALEMTKETDEAFDQLAKISSDQLWREVAEIGKAELMWKKNYEKRLTN